MCNSNAQITKRENKQTKTSSSLSNIFIGLLYCTKEKNAVPFTFIHLIFDFSLFEHVWLRPNVVFMGWTKLLFVST